MALELRSDTLAAVHIVVHAQIYLLQIYPSPADVKAFDRVSL